MGLGDTLSQKDKIDTSNDNREITLLKGGVCYHHIQLLNTVLASKISSSSSTNPIITKALAAMNDTEGEPWIPHGKAIVNNNQWSVLPVDPIETEEDLNETAEQFCSVVNVTAMELGIKQHVLGGKMYLNRSLKKKMEKVNKERHAWEQA